MLNFCGSSSYNSTIRLVSPPPPSPPPSHTTTTNTTLSHHHHHHHHHHRLTPPHPPPPTDVNECLTRNGGCHFARVCTNTPGGLLCSDCSDGWTNNGDTGCRGWCQATFLQCISELLLICHNNVGYENNLPLCLQT